MGKNSTPGNCHEINYKPNLRYSPFHETLPYNLQMHLTRQGFMKWAISKLPVKLNERLSGNTNMFNG